MTYKNKQPTIETKKPSIKGSFEYDPDFANALENALKSISKLHGVVQEKFGKYESGDPYKDGS